jgi:hypothetical protein
MATEESMPMIETVTNNSINVNPFIFFIFKSLTQFPTFFLELLHLKYASL